MHTSTVARTVVAAAALIAAAPALATDPPSPAPTRVQGQVDPASGAMAVRPKGMDAPSAGWTDAERGEAAIARGKSALDESMRAYQAAKHFSDRAEVSFVLPDGEQNEVIEVRFGDGNDMHLKLGSLEVFSVGQQVSFVPDQPDDKVLQRPLAGSPNATLATMVPGFDLPIPDLAMRQPLAGKGAVDAFTLGGLKGIAVRGFREKGGMREVLMGSANADCVARIDPATGFVRSVEMMFSPEGMPNEVKVGLRATMAPSAAPLASPIAFDQGKRKAVAKMEDLFDAPADNEMPGVNVKDGQDAPTAVLTTLAGKALDVASFRGKVVVIDFWATWCGPCRKGLPLLQQFADEMKGNDAVVVYAVNVWEQSKGDELTKKVSEFWTKQGFTMNVALDPEAQLIGKYGFQGIPACIIIGRDGKLVTSHMGYDPGMVDKLRDEVKKALGDAK